MKWAQYIIAGLFLFSTYAVGYIVVRSDFTDLVLSLIVLFSGYYYFYFKSLEIKLSHGLLLALLTRLILLPSFPSLSDDVHRFLWDGLLTNHGISPFELTPRQALIAYPDFLSQSLFSSLNSPDYYSVYPPISQGLYGIAAYISGNSILTFTMILKVTILLCEVGVVSILIKLLAYLKLPRHHVLMYALNPLVIIEGTGNLHFELFMGLFALLAILFLVTNRHVGSPLFLALSIAVKMVSAILWPFFIPILGFKRWLLYSIGLGLVIILLFFPLWNPVYLSHFKQSLDLYFTTFEFNASIYYILRELGVWINGYNPIAIVGPALSGISFLAICLFIWLNRKSSIKQVLTFFILAFTVYLIFSTTVHPWYLILPLCVAPLTNLRYIYIWSALIFLSYSAYSHEPVRESALFLTMEYLGLLVALYFDRVEIASTLHVRQSFRPEKTQSSLNSD